MKHSPTADNVEETRDKTGRILAVTGATGDKSGGAFARRLADNAVEISHKFPGGVRLLVRDASKVDSAIIDVLSPDICIGDASSASYLNKALEGVDTLVHVAGIKLSPDIANAAVVNGVRRLILVHTTGIYSKYKEAGEEYRHIDAYVKQLCEENDIVLTILRPTMIYGNVHDRNVVQFIQMVDKLPIMPVVDGARFALQPVHYEDLADAYYAVLMNESSTKNKDFDLSGGEVIELRDMLQVIGWGLGKQVRFMGVPFGFAYTASRALYAITAHRIDYREKVQRLVEPRAYSHDEATQAFGYAPRSFREGVAAEIAEYLAMYGRL